MNEYFRKCTNNSSFSPEDIDIILLDEIKRVYNIKLYSESPINTGMTALVYKGNMNGVDVAIKIARDNIRPKLLKGFKEIKLFYNLTLNL